MSTKSTIFYTNDFDEHCYEDCAEPHTNKEGLRKDAISIEFDKKNIRIDANDDDCLCITITNVDSDLYKIFERLGEIVPKHLK